ncbi:MAG TPA: hypothetical protein VIV88_05880 [Gemmatimonadales bacterium]|jgi:hypothetical protein
MDRVTSEWADMVKGPRWARIRDGVRCRLRRGAWYPVLSAGPHSAVLDVRGMSISVHHAYLVLSFARPTRWSIVRRPPDAGLMPESWGAWYAVCPGCAGREPVRQVAGTMACTRCDQSFHIDWSASATPLDERIRPTPAHPHAA